MIQTDNIINNGYGHDILKKIEEYSMYDFEFVELASDPYTQLLNKEVDLIGFYKYDEEYFDLFIPVTSYINTDYYSLVTKKNSDTFKELYYDDPKSIDNKTVSTYLSNPANTLLDQYCRNHGINVNYLYYDYHDYLSYDADLYLTTTLSDDYYTLLILGLDQSTLIGRVEDTDLVNSISNIIDHIKIEEGNFFVDSALKCQYYYNFFPQRTLTRDEVNYLRDNTLDVGYLENSSLITHKDETGQLGGILIEAIDIFANLYDFDVNYVPFTYDEYYNVPADLDILLTIYGKDNKIQESYIPSEILYNFDLMAIYDDKVLEEHQYDFNINIADNIGTLHYLSQSTKIEKLILTM